ncbi:protocadherin gamma-C5-like [Amblyraja radiata]|uniref:protocadherin gamma-C5-like n=1 Tax=Amblyraja radiata TaxID=386614 RepID=UPI00140282B1|nr:protocadherin gamma-C5-like [Amblyraja radiata]
MANSAINNVAGFIILVCTTGLISGQIRYSVYEEMEEGALVGNIAQDLGLAIPQLSARKFRLISDDGGQYMKMNVENGILSMREKIDRERICGQATICTISFKIILENPLAVHRGEVEILDVNDNAPAFRGGTIALQIVETMTPGVAYPLESAEDPDVGINAIASYTISSNDYFNLKTQRTDDGIIIAELVLEKPLDRELHSSFQLVLTATDGGTPQRTGTAQILVTVVDNNDNPPVFNQNIYRSHLRENTPLGTLVAHVEANDLDEGLNAELTYSFSKLTSQKVRDLFSLDPDSGEIRTEGVIDFEEAKGYSLNVQAVDHGSPPATGHAKVLVKIIDENDNAPEVKVMSTTNTVPENASPGTLITLVNVIDGDTGENGQVSCEIPKNIPFILQTSSMNHYELITSEPLDRESIPVYQVNIEAWDLGSPSLSTNKTIQIVIADINDNVPRFSEPSYNIYVMENNAPGTSIFEVTAIDRDLNQNSYVSYYLLGNRIQDMPLSTQVSINSMNGTIYAMRSFDYEKLKNVQFHVQARDAGVPPLSSSTTVNVIILDQNDNAPVIGSPTEQSGSAAVVILPQSAAPGYLVTKVMANDADSGQNARLFYHMQSSSDPSVFNVGKNSGEIRTARKLLESDATTQTLVILVKDNGQPSLSSMVTIQVTILENITERIVESENLVTNREYFSDLNIHLIVIFGCTSVLFLVIIILLISIKCKQDGNSNQEYNSTSCCCKPGNSDDAFARRAALEETLRYPGTGRLSRVPDAHNYSVCLSPESAKSDFLFLKTCGTPMSGLNPNIA